MSQQELLRRVVEVLDAAAVPYMATGSVVSSLQGAPRSTHDIDFVVAITAAAVDTLAAAFQPPSYYLDAVAARSAIARADMFNLLEISTGNKVDFWMLTDDPFDRERFGRRYAVTAFGHQLFVSRPEDTILQKLRWAEMSGGSTKQFEDALRVYELQFSRLDIPYLQRWAKTLGVEALLARLQVAAQPI